MSGILSCYNGTTWGSVLAGQSTVGSCANQSCDTRESHTDFGGRPGLHVKSSFRVQDFGFPRFGALRA